MYIPIMCCAQIEVSVSLSFEIRQKLRVLMLGVTPMYVHSFNPGLVTQFTNTCILGFPRGCI